MKTGIFVLTKREQRAVVLIMIALLLGTIAARYHENRSKILGARSTSPETAATISPPPAEEEPAASDDAP
jgi:hypothetical protein